MQLRMIVSFDFYIHLLYNIYYIYHYIYHLLSLTDSQVFTASIGAGSPCRRRFGIHQQVPDPSHAWAASHPKATSQSFLSSAKPQLVKARASRSMNLARSGPKIRDA